MRKIRADEVRKGDFIYFKSYRLRVNAEPVTKGNGVVITGRISTNGCEIVNKWFLSSKVVKVLDKVWDTGKNMDRESYYATKGDNMKPIKINEAKGE